MNPFPTLALCAFGLLASACQVKPYTPPPRPVTVTSVDIETNEFHGRPEAWATIRGHLSTSAAQFAGAKQSREGRHIRIEMLERTPRGAELAPDLVDSPYFERRIPIDVIGLDAGPCTLSVNEFETVFQLPDLTGNGTSS